MVVPQKCRERSRHGFASGALTRCSPDTSLVGKSTVVWQLRITYAISGDVKQQCKQKVQKVLP